MNIRLGKAYLLLLAALGVALVGGLGISGCAQMPTMLPTPAQLAAAGSFPEGGDAASLARGRALAQTQCLGCHRFFWPHEYAPQAWPPLVRNMGNQNFLTRQQIDDITHYMVAASRATRNDVYAPPAKAEIPPADPATVLRGRALARKNCAECHRLRSPHEFPAEAWPEILRAHRSLVSFSEDDLRTIAWYYVETARSGR